MEGRSRDAILGVSADYHDAAAALVVGGEVVAAAEEERFSRRKHDPELPTGALRWALEAHDLRPGDLAAVAFYAKPFTTFERVLWSHGRAGLRGAPGMARAIATWARRKVWVEARLGRVLAELGPGAPRPAYVEHHQSHAASAFFPSPFEQAAVLTFDGVGEWTTSSIGVGDAAGVRLLEELRYPDSIGLFYSAMTAYCGFAVNDGEYKLMGLAPYGTPRYEAVLRDRVVRVHPDGSVQLDLRWFSFLAGDRMTRPRLAELLDGPPRAPGEPLTQREADLAASAQAIVEEVVLRAGRHAHERTGLRHACLAGGVALNCVANRRLLEDGPFDDVWVQPASSDAGGALGAALWVHHHVRGGDRPALADRPGRDGMAGAALGPRFGHDEVAAWLRAEGIAFTEHRTPEALAGHLAPRLAAGAVLGWFQGAMEYGPRALGHRSILADPRDPDLVQRLNLQVKGREAFRPFAPAVAAEHASAWFELDRPAPYMTVTAAVRGAVPGPAAAGDGPLDLAGRLRATGSPIAACTHVDGSARVQTVAADVHPALHALLDRFGACTGVPVLVNTSFNVADEPIVRTPADAVRCAARAGLDLLAIEGCVVERGALAA